MLPTKPLTDVLKSAPEVTFLSATDRVQIVDANGVPKRITQKDFLSDINDFGVNLVPGSLKYFVSSSVSFIVEAGTPVVLSVGSYTAVNGEQHESFRVFNRATPSDQIGAYVSVSPTAPLSMVSMGCITLYSNPMGYSADKGYFHKLKLEKGYSASKWSPAPEDLISLLGGGINRYSSTHYAILQKGGLRDDADEGTYQRTAEEQDDGCDGVSWKLFGLRDLYSGWCLSRKHYFSEPSRRSLQLWNPKSIPNSRIHPSGVCSTSILRKLQRGCVAQDLLFWILDSVGVLRPDTFDLAYGKEVVAA